MRIAQVIAVALFTVCSFVASAQEKSGTFKVSGNCGMCKKTIENAAKIPGVSTFNWDKEKKMATVNFDSSKTTLAAIQKKIASSGYDTQLFKADEKAYQALPSCCQYRANKKPAHH